MDLFSLLARAFLWYCADELVAVILQSCCLSSFSEVESLVSRFLDVSWMPCELVIRCAANETSAAVNSGKEG
jgi:hypothetical protein